MQIRVWHSDLSGLVKLNLLHWEENYFDPFYFKVFEYDYFWNIYNFFG